VRAGAERTAVVTRKVGGDLAQRTLHNVISAGAAMALDIQAHLQALREEEDARAPRRRRGDDGRHASPEGRTPKRRRRDDA
jgi:hypothetical protein